MEKKLVVLTAAFALTAGLVFAQTMKNNGDEMAENTEVMIDDVGNNAAMNEENVENAENVENFENAEMDAEENAENAEMNAEENAQNAEMNAEENAQMDAEAPLMNEEVPAVE